ncbi:VCBS repeat-containing protein [bacterium]|nr:VCBS repeat-containing protein [bacterium]
MKTENSMRNSCRLVSVTFFLSLCCSSVPLLAQQYFSSIHSSFPSYSATESLDIDLDGDGFRDIIAASLPSGDGLVVLKNNGGLFFEDITGTAMAPTSRFPFCESLAAADLNGDGPEEFICGETNRFALDQVQIFSFQQGQLVNTQSLQHTSLPQHLEVGDFDGDGDRDLLVVGNTAAFYFNDGAGRLGAAVAAPQFDRASSVHSADINSDGVLDLLVGTLPAKLMLGTGSGGFNEDLRFSQSTSGISGVPSGIASGDVDGDGDLDVFLPTTGTGGILSILRNDGANGWGNLSSLIPLSYATTVRVDLHVEDFNGDGLLDLFSGGVGVIPRYFPQVAPGVFQDQTQQLFVWHGSFQADAVLAFDFDRNGTVDVLTDSQQEGSRFFANGGALFVDITGLAGVPRSTTSMVPFDACPADFDGDGELEYLVVYSFGPNMIYETDGSGTFINGRPLPVGTGASRSAECATGDLDGDGDLDIVIANGILEAVDLDDLYINDGQGNFTQRSTALPLHHSSSRRVEIADMNGDGRPDIVLAGQNRMASGLDSNRIYINNGGLQFSSQSYLPRDGGAFDMTLGDVDNDGDLDIFVAHAVGHELLLNDGSGTMSSLPQPSFPNVGAVGAQFFDANGDAFLDLVVGSNSSAGRREAVYLGGSGVRFHRVPLPEAFSGEAVITLDVNEDSIQDIVFGNTGNQESFAGRVFIGNGDGSYRRSRPLPVTSPNFLLSMTAVDIDGDGDRDLLVAEDSTNRGQLPIFGRMEVLLNRYRHLDIRSPLVCNSPFALELDSGEPGTIAYLYFDTQLPRTVFRTPVGEWRLPAPVYLAPIPLDTIDQITAPPLSGCSLGRLSFQAIFREPTGLRLSSAVTAPIL